jgi:putative superfamily III holin-X
MPTRSSNGHGLAEAARHVTEHATAIAKLETRLALQEVKRKATKMVGAVVLLAGAGVFAGIALLVGIAAGVAAIALVLPVWLSLLIVMGGLLLLAGPLGVVGLVLLKRGTPPVPEQAIEEAKLTTEALKNGRH